MPELPEVETVVRSLAPVLPGRRIQDAVFGSHRVLRGDPRETAARLRGRRVEAVRRHGKNILIELDNNALLCVHLGMTGRLVWQAEPGPYSHAVFEFEGGRLVYDDPRQFGRIELAETLPDRLAGLGPEPLAITAEEFIARLGARRGAIKPLLLNQRFLRGVGNIYADESLFRARIHPRARAERLGRERRLRLHTAIQEILTAAIRSGGSSISDYVDGNGRSGWFQFEHRVYGKEGQPCAVCGTPIRRIVLGQRGTHYCPKCQR